MFKKRLNLTFSKSNFSFFSHIDAMKKSIQKFNENPASLYEFKNADEEEIGRADTYAMFKELKEDADNGTKITIESFRKSLKARGVTNIEFQNKILCMILQNKVGVQYGLGNIVNNLFLSSGFALIMDANYKISMKVNKKNDVTLFFKGTWNDYITEPRIPAISVNASVNITPDMVTINGFDVTKIANNNSTATSAFKHLEDNQQNVLEKFLSWIQRFFSNSELLLEETKNDIDTLRKEFITDPDDDVDEEGKLEIDEEEDREVSKLM